jgi:hypothetical protein
MASASRSPSVVSCRSGGAAQRSWIANLAYEQAVLGSLEQNVESGNEGLQLATAGMATLLESAGLSVAVH